MIVPMLITMDSEGQLVLPEQVRQALQIDEGTRFALEITENALVLRPVTVVAANAQDWLWETRPLPRVRQQE
jgi:bifunctional DNA-binding transcriptional regulator/antitoxin component of YhaV-PrlF toxin-antitoxin module